jgi:hypothetical protein
MHQKRSLEEYLLPNSGEKDYRDDKLNNFCELKQCISDDFCYITHKKNKVASPDYH